MNFATENKIFLPFTVISTLALYIVLFSVGSGLLKENFSVIVISIVTWIVWLGLFLRDKRKGAQIADKNSLLWLKLLIAVLISLFFANTIWLSNYLTLNPIHEILSGKLHIDTAFHTTISESIKNYGCPSVLLNNGGFLQYHFGSHVVMAILSSILNISVFEAYNYIYPVICIPLYSYLVVAVIIEIRTYKNETTRLSLIDYLFLALFFVGFIPTFILKNIGISKSSWIVSESFLFALIFFLCYVLLMLKIIAKRQNKNLLIFLLTLLFIVVCSSMKISVGFLLTAGIIYINFRKNTRKIRSWIANVIFLVTFLISYKIFSGAGGDVNFQLFSFVKQYTIFFPLGAVLHYFFLLFFMLLFLYCQCSINRPVKYAIQSKKMLIEETLVVVCILSLLPGLFLNIPGGSAGYFSVFQELIAICLLLGYNIPDKLQQKMQTQSVRSRKGIKFCMIFLLLIVLFNATYPVLRRYALHYIHRDSVHNTISNTLLTNVKDINKITKNEKINYAIYLDDSAEIWNVYKNKEKVAIFLYPALTGIKVLNAVHTDGIEVFSSNGVPIQKVDPPIYGINKSVITQDIDGEFGWVAKLSLDEAKECARNRSFKYIVYLYNDEYQIIEL